MVNENGESVSLLESQASPDAKRAVPYKRPGLRLLLLLLAGATVVVLYVANAPAAPGQPVEESEFQKTVHKAAKRALGGGLSGAIAGVVQVFTLMWLRTTMNYQYRYGTSTGEALRTLYAQGGIIRLYQGWQYALITTPLTRFGDTAANSGVLAVLAATEVGSYLPVGVRTGIASGAAVLWRMLITPLDTLKTTLQVEGADGYRLLVDKMHAEGVVVLWQGAVAAAVANFVGNYPWFLTFNFLDEVLPPAGPLLTFRFLRSALLGFSASCVSDSCSNSLRIIKVARQTAPTSVSYRDAALQVLRHDGWSGLLGRGLGTRILTNGLQASLFTIVWKLLEAELTGLGGAPK